MIESIRGIHVPRRALFSCVRNVDYVTLQSKRSSVIFERIERTPADLLIVLPRSWRGRVGRAACLGRSFDHSAIRAHNHLKQNVRLPGAYFVNSS